MSVIKGLARISDLIDYKSSSIGLGKDNLAIQKCTNREDISLLAKR